MSTSTRSRVGFAILTAGLIALTTAFVVSAGKSLEAQNATAPANGVITGVVRSDKGPEAGVWVIAETKDLPTNFIKIVVTDDQGRFLLPELPTANYSVWVRGYGLVDSAKVMMKPGANTVTWGFPVTVVLVAVACGNFGRAFCLRSECRWRPGTFRTRRMARAAEPAVAASASSDEVAVTWVDVMERITWWRAAVKDSSSAVTGAASFLRRARAAACSPRSAAAALARVSWVAVSQAQASWMTSRGEPDRRTGPEVRFPAPVIVALSSPNVVSDALHLVR